ncbi:MAG TPA: virulence-associated E family protein [Roseiarcus sp.]|jgi:predicted P-loop ATPase
MSADVLHLDGVRASPTRRSRPKEAPWLKHCAKDDRDRIISNLDNVMVALEAAPELAGCLAFDEMSRTTMVMKGLPTTPGDECAGDGRFPRAIRDTDVSRLQRWLQRVGLPKVGRDITHQAVDLQAERDAFHPVRDFLNGLKWDGRERIASWLVDYLGAEASPYTLGIGQLFLVAMVARVFRPGCKADYMLVLEGEQGAGKSRACRVLAGEWFSDGLPDIHHKDAAQHLRGKWLIEVAELSATSKADAEALKAFVSRPIERYRPAYGHREVNEPRQCVFVGTTNRTAYLKDETGGRRFWPVKVERIDIDALVRDRNQLFAEAVLAFQADQPWWPDGKFERSVIKPEQEARFETDAWSQPICAYLKGKIRVRVTDIAHDALGFEVARIGTSEQRRITGVLTSFGWKPGRDWQGRFFSPGTMSHD